MLRRRHLGTPRRPREHPLADLVHPAEVPPFLHEEQGALRGAAHVEGLGDGHAEVGPGADVLLEARGGGVVHPEDQVVPVDLAPKPAPREGGAAAAHHRTAACPLPRGGFARLGDRGDGCARLRGHVVPEFEAGRPDFFERLGVDPVEVLGHPQPPRPLAPDPRGPNMQVHPVRPEGAPAALPLEESIRLLEWIAPPPAHPGVQLRARPSNDRLRRRQGAHHVPGLLGHPEGHDVVHGRYRAQHGAQQVLGGKGLAEGLQQAPQEPCLDVVTVPCVLGRCGGTCRADRLGPRIPGRGTRRAVRDPPPAAPVRRGDFGDVGQDVVGGDVDGVPSLSVHFDLGIYGARGGEAVVFPEPPHVGPLLVLLNSPTPRSTSEVAGEERG
mmetsp:Transcript_41026/g.131184  ORF Transcript_41026/g.131184 Transcript_41026/m.131184 type:complete len:383 (+) Transcript_41026:481-1629(+)